MTIDDCDVTSTYLYHRSANTGADDVYRRIGVILRGGVDRKQKAGEREEKAKELTACRGGIRQFTSLHWRVLADSRIMSS